MRKSLRGAMAAGLLFASMVPAAADPGHERPKITVFRFAQPPLKAGINEVLRVVAHDPDSWISEVQVRWEDANGDGGVVFAHTGCVQDRDYNDPGGPARLKIPVNFEQPGSYHVEARAISSFKCRGGDSSKTSRTLEMDVQVFDPLTTSSDPDDASGPFDISSIDQTQESSETSATTEIVQRIRMFDAFTNDQLAGSPFMEMWFDLDDDASTFERVLTIDLNESDTTLRASMLDTTTGQSRGYAAVGRPDEMSIEVRFPPLLLKKGVHSYRWYASVDGGSEGSCSETPCTDRAPDTELLRHRL